MKMCESEDPVYESQENDSCHGPSEFCDYYKYTNRDKTFSLEKRREYFLQKQKEKRNVAFDEKRDISELFPQNVERMECDSAPRTKHARKFPFGYKLMASELFIEVPPDLSENWLIKVCPEGVRYLVVANRALTTCYYRNGRPSIKFKSKLPGGNAETAHKFTLLDCIYNKDLNTMFVYDVLAWNSTSLLEAEAQMRFFWLKTKFEENPEICEISKRRDFHFVVVGCLPAEKSLLQEQFFSPFVVKDVQVGLDGVLFYHKEGHYVFGRSPLVGWLRSFMISEVLNVDVGEMHLQRKPKEYESVQQYLSFKKRKRQDLHESVKSETSELMQEF